ncbi:hypothetical protein FOA52_014238 [Chlamydomonas sp. UWO 241]|nr:hypothetical protein FOA52_014238 [Chlamydomonas sp. UWO 241]
MYLSFQRRLSIIGGTLAALVPELFHFILVVTVLFCMMAIFLNTIFGYRVYATSTFGEAIFTLFKMLVFGDDAELYYALNVPGLDAPLERSMASAFRGVASVLIVWVLRMYLAAFIILIYAGLNQYAKHMPAVSQDLRRMFQWWAQKVLRKAPSNSHIEKMLDKVLEEGRGPSGLLQRVRSTIARSVLQGAAGPDVRANLGALPGSMGFNTRGGGGGIRLGGFSSLVSSNDLEAALLLASGCHKPSAGLSASPNGGRGSGWINRPTAGQGQRGSQEGVPLRGPMDRQMRNSMRLSISEIAFTAGDSPLSQGHGCSLADILIERQKCGAAGTASGAAACSPRGEQEHQSPTLYQRLTPDPVSPGGRALRVSKSLGRSELQPTRRSSLLMHSEHDDTAQLPEPMSPSDVPPALLAPWGIDTVALPSASRLWEGGLLRQVSPVLPTGGRVRPSDTDGEGHDAAPMAAPLPGGGGTDREGPNEEQARDLATVHDALMARFGTAGGGGAGVGGAGNAAGGGGGRAAHVVSGARSRKTAAGRSALRQRLTVMDVAPGTTAGDEGPHTEVDSCAASQGIDPNDAVNSEESRRLHRALFRATLVELAHAQGQMSALRASQAELERLAAALTSALPPRGSGGPHGAAHSEQPPKGSSRSQDITAAATGTECLGRLDQRCRTAEGCDCGARNGGPWQVWRAHRSARRGVGLHHAHARAPAGVPGYAADRTEWQGQDVTVVATAATEFLARHHPRCRRAHGCDYGGCNHGLQQVWQLRHACLSASVPGCTGSDGPRWQSRGAWAPRSGVGDRTGAPRQSGLPIRRCRRADVVARGGAHSAPDPYAATRLVVGSFYR